MTTKILQAIFKISPFAKNATIFLGVIAIIALAGFITSFFLKVPFFPKFFLTLLITGIILIPFTIWFAYLILPKHTYRIKTNLKVYSPFIKGFRFTLDAKVESFELRKGEAALLNERTVYFKVRKSDDLFDKFLEQLETAIAHEQHLLFQNWKRESNDGLTSRPPRMFIERRYRKELRAAIAKPTQPPADLENVGESNI